MTELFEQVQNWTALVLHAGAPASFEVRFGETVALDQFVNHSTGQNRVSDNQRQRTLRSSVLARSFHILRARVATAPTDSPDETNLMSS